MTLNMTAPLIRRSITFGGIRHNNVFS